VRLVPRLVTLLLAIALAACGSSAASSSTPTGVAAGQPCSSAGLKYAPSPSAIQGATPPDGHYRVQGSDQPVAIRHTQVVCGQKFVERLDFGPLLGHMPHCVDNPASADHRPCANGFRAEPDNSFGLLNTTDAGPKQDPATGKPYWRPVEGNQLEVVCQYTGNADPAHGSTTNGAGITSNVKDKVHDPQRRIEGGREFGIMSDLVLGNAGNRGIPCPDALTNPALQ
jgi:hypothetical protein